MKIKKIIFCFVSIVSIMLYYNNAKAEELKNIKVIPKNSILYCNYITNNLEINKKYKVSENEVLFKKILIAKWAGPPHAVFTFKDSMKYDMVSYMTGRVREIGSWKIEGDNLLLKKNNKWGKFKIKYFILDKNKKRNKVKYELYIIFDGMLNDVSDALVITFSYKKT